MLLFEDGFTVTLHGEEFVIYEGILNEAGRDAETKPDTRTEPPLED
jgi:hypothetical protein